MPSEVVSARIPLEELHAYCRFQCGHTTAYGRVVRPASAAGKRDRPRPGHGKKKRRSSQSNCLGIDCAIPHRRCAIIPMSVHFYQ
jgi:hypothetical protein